MAPQSTDSTIIPYNPCGPCAFNNGGIIPAPLPAADTYPVITDGLVWYLDAGNTDSYPGSGKDWTNLISGGPDGELLNGAAYSADGGGSISLDGTDDKIGMGAYISPYSDVDIGSTFTFEMWMNRTASTEILAGHVSFANGGYIFYATGTLIYSSAPSGYSSVSNSIPTDGTWTRLTLTRTGTAIEWFVNGASIGTGTVGAGNNIVSTLGAYLNSTFALEGKIAEVEVYNRVLTDQEVQDNYDNTKTRYGH